MSTATPVTRFRAAALMLLFAALAGARPAAAQQWPVEIFATPWPDIGGVPSTLIRASDGNLYGVAADASTGHGGSIFRMGLDGTLSVIYRFSGGVDGDTPASGLLQGQDGHLYGMCVDGGRYGFGTIFRLTLDGRFTLLYSFSGEPDGAFPSGKLMQRSDGSFYGVTSGGGAWNKGSAFRMSADGTVTPVHHFNDGQPGGWAYVPVLGLVESGEAFVGIVEAGLGAHGAAKVYRMSIDGSTVTFLFTVSLSDGDYSFVSLTGLPIKASDGNLYFASRNGCKGQNGTFYRITPDGIATLIREFESCEESPQTELTELRDGSFVVPGRRRILRLTASGELMAVHRSESGMVYAYTPLVEMPDGKVYGIGSSGRYRVHPKSVTPKVRVSRRAPIQVSWTPILGATSYTVRRIRATGEVEALARLSGTSFVDLTAVPGQRYVYSVTSTALYGESEFVEAATAVVVVNRSTAYDADADGRADVISYELYSGRWRIRPPDGQFYSGIRWGERGDVVAPGDFDGDAAMDIAVFRPSNGTWYIRGSSPVMWGQAGDTPVPADYDGDGVTEIAVYRRSSGTWYVRGKAPIAWGDKNDIPVPADFNGDGATDIAVYRPSTGVWYVRGLGTVSYGIVGDTPMPADYNGDGTADFAVYRRTTGTWFVRGQFAIEWGIAGDIPVTLDRDGDGRVELGVYRRGSWYFRDLVTGTVATVSWGYDTLPIGAGIAQQQRVTARAGRDYDNDGRDDVMVYRPATGEWMIRTSERGASVRFNRRQRGIPIAGNFGHDTVMDIGEFVPGDASWSMLEGWGRDSWAAKWGTTGDIPVPGDYDGDAKTDVAVFRPAEGVWYIQWIGNYRFGDATDIPVPADYNGDGITDIAVFRPGTGTWYVLGAEPIRFGADGDIPVPADYDGDGITDIAVYRPSTGEWYVRNQFTLQWGIAGDVPVPLDRDGDGRAELIVYRPSNGTWYFYNPVDGAVESLAWGAPGDVPVGRGAYWAYR